MRGRGREDSGRQAAPGSAIARLKGLHIVGAIFLTVFLGSLFYYCFMLNWPDQVAYSAISALDGEWTVYKKGYSERRFRSLRVGMTKRDVLAIMGEPLRRARWAGRTDGAKGEYWSYTKPSKPMGDYKQREVYFGDGKVIDVASDYYFD